MAEALRYVHWFAGALWIGALLVVALRRARGHDDPARDRRLYRWVATPAAFVTLLTLVAMLHAAPQLLRGRATQVELLALGALAACDFLCERPSADRRRAALTVVGLVVAGGVAAVTDVMAFGRSA